MTYLVAISGGSGSGKTTFIKKLEEMFNPAELVVLSQDHYYKPQHLQMKDETGEVNFDLPESIDMDRFITDIETLKAGNELTINEYNYNIPEIPVKEIVLKPAGILVIEGLFVLINKEIESKLDLKIFMEATEDIKLERRLKRDSLERGLTETAINYQWNNHVKPSYDTFILPQREKADMVIMNNTHFENSFKVVAHHFRQVLNENIA